MNNSAFAVILFACSVNRGDNFSANSSRASVVSASIILKNTSAGIYGAVESGYSAGAKKPVPVASKSAVHTGKAEIYANIEENKVETFEVEIVKIMKHAQDDKNMIIRVTDQRLIDKTGGIVQGMSGSPIIQDGKLVVTIDREVFTLEQLEQRFGRVAREQIADAARRWQLSGDVVVNDRQIYIPPERFLLSDAVIESLFEV